MSITKSLSVDFGGSLNSAQFYQEIQNEVSITATLEDVAVELDVVTIEFDRTLDGGETTALDGLISSHVATNFNTTLHQDTIEPTTNNDLIQGFGIRSRWLNTTTNKLYECLDASVGAAVWKQLNNPDIATKIYVSPDGEGDYTSIKAALDNSVAGQVIKVTSGTYVEVNPLVIPDYVSLVGESVGNTTIVGAVNNTNVVEVGHNCVLANITVLGANATGGVGVYYDLAGVPKRSLLNKVQVTGCETGILVEATAPITTLPTLLGTEIFVASTDVYTLKNGWVVRNGGSVRFTSCAIIGNPLNIIETGIMAYGTGTSVYVQDSGINYCNTAINTTQEAAVKISGGEYFGNDQCFYIPSGSVNTTLDVLGTLIDSTTNWDINIQCPNVERVTISGCRLLSNKINNPYNVKLLSTFVNDEEENRSQTILGELHVGHHKEPASTSLGGGSSYVIGTEVMTYDGTNYTSQTTFSKSRGGSIFNAFDGPTAGNMLYVGSDNHFNSIELLLNNEIDLGTSGTIETEYYDGSGWQHLHILYTEGDAPYYPFAEQVFTSPTALSNTDTPFNIRFGTTTNWATTTINSLNLYWMRFRIVNDITTIPIIEQIKLRGNSTLIHKDGFIEYFGTARPIKRLPWDLNIAKPAGYSPIDRDLYLSDGLQVGRTENGFSGNAIDRTGLNAFLPYEIDTSLPIRLIWSWYSDGNTGDVRWVVRWGTSTDGTPIYTNTVGAPTTADKENSLIITETVPGTAQTQQTTTAELDISNVIPIQKANLYSGELLWISLERTGNHGDDTSTDNIVLIQLAPFYFARAEGFHPIFN